jgi:hypothetical protein
VDVLPFSPCIIIQAHTFGQGMWDKLHGAIEEYFGCTFMGAYWVHVALSYCLSWIFIFNFVPPHFWCTLLQELGYLLWFRLISCVASRSCFSLCEAMGLFDLPTTKTLWIFYSLTSILTFFSWFMDLHSSRLWVNVIHLHLHTLVPWPIWH